jgi:hypothetical protein
MQAGEAACEEAGKEFAQQKLFYVKINCPRDLPRTGEQNEEGRTF